MKVISQGPGWAKVRASLRVMKNIFMTEMPKNYCMEVNNEVLLFTGAKAFYKGGGIWLLSGYTQNDVPNAIAKIQ